MSHATPPPAPTPQHPVASVGPELHDMPDAIPQRPMEPSHSIPEMAPSTTLPAHARHEPARELYDDLDDEPVGFFASTGGRLLAGLGVLLLLGGIGGGAWVMTNDQGTPWPAQTPLAAIPEPVIEQQPVAADQGIAAVESDTLAEVEAQVEREEATAAVAAEDAPVEAIEADPRAELEDKDESREGAADEGDEDADVDEDGETAEEEELEPIDPEQEAVIAALKRRRIRALDLNLVDPERSKKMRFPRAEAYCSKKNVQGVTQWRVPTIAELGSLVDAKIIRRDTYWSSTKGNTMASRRLVYNIKRGRIYATSPKWRGGRVICVRSRDPSQIPSSDE